MSELASEPSALTTPATAGSPPTPRHTAGTRRASAPRAVGGLGIATEFWEADERRFYCSCTGCGWTGEITPTGAVAMGHEPEH